MEKVPSWWQDRCPRSKGLLLLIQAPEWRSCSEGRRRPDRAGDAPSTALQGRAGASRWEQRWGGGSPWVPSPDAPDACSASHQPGPPCPSTSTLLWGRLSGSPPLLHHVKGRSRASWVRAPGSAEEAEGRGAHSQPEAQGPTNGRAGV